MTKKALTADEHLARRNMAGTLADFFDIGSAIMLVAAFWCFIGWIWGLDGRWFWTTVALSSFFFAWGRAFESSEKEHAEQYKRITTPKQATTK